MPTCARAIENRKHPRAPLQRLGLRFEFKNFIYTFWESCLGPLVSYGRSMSQAPRQVVDYQKIMRGTKSQRAFLVKRAALAYTGGALLCAWKLPCNRRTMVVVAQFTRAYRLAQAGLLLACK